MGFCYYEHAAPSGTVTTPVSTRLSPIYHDIVEMHTRARAHTHTTTHTGHLFCIRSNQIARTCIASNTSYPTVKQSRDTLKKFVQSEMPPGNTFTIPLVREDWVKKTRSTLDKNKATCLDNIPAKLLKIAALYIAKTITQICNHSIKHGSFPRTWKIARVTPLHKRDSVHELTNYRPISILPILSKVLERHVFNAFL